MSDIETSDWSEIAANNIQPAPAGWPANSSPMIVYSNGREDMGAIKRDWDRRNPTVTSGGSANVQTLAYVQGPVAYVMGQMFSFFAGFSNSGACTLNVNGLGAKAIQLNGAALAAGAIIAGSITQCVYDGTQFQLTLAGSGAYLPLTGGTLTGNLTVAPASGPSSLVLNAAASGINRNITGQTGGLNRWSMWLGSPVAESGSNAGSDFAIQRYNDAGTVVETSLSINRANGQITIPQNVFLDNTVASGARSISGRTSGSTRWQIAMGNTTAEGGSNAGSDWTLNRFNDAGTFVSPVVITATRSNGVVTFGAAIVNGPSDRTLKENIAPLTGSLDKVQRLQGVSFDFIKDPTKRRQIGLVAQDVAPIVPEVLQDYVQPDEPPALAIDYTRLVPLLIEALKELSAKVTRLEAGLAAASQA